MFTYYGTSMAAAVRIRSGLGFYFTPPPPGLELRSSQSLHQVLGTRATTVGQGTSQTDPCNGLFRPGVFFNTKGFGLSNIINLIFLK